MIITPKAYDGSTVEKFWKDETWDKNIPKGGFISDFLLSLRGIETPTKLQIWTALFLISTVLKRDAWLLWHPKKFYANLYVVLVAPPAVCRKSTAVTFADEFFLQDYHNLIEDDVLRKKKELRINRTRATSESLFKLLKPRQDSIIVDGHSVPVLIGSDGCFIVSELATFLGRQQYNLGLIDMLTNLYDCKNVEDSFTLSRNQELLQNIYITIIGATTPDGLAESIPERAFGDGFLSRVIIVSSDFSERKYSRPKPVIGGPSADDLKERLAWIAENAVGEYTFSPEADEYFDKWYDDFQSGLKENTAHINKSLSRYDIHLRKVALLIRAQRYEAGNVVSLQDLKDAEAILKDTYNEAKIVTEQVQHDSSQKATRRIQEYLQKKVSVARRKLLTSFSDRHRVKEINEALRELHELGYIKIKIGNSEVQYISQNGDEIYEWAGPNESN